MAISGTCREPLAMASAGNGYDPAMHDSINIFSRRIYKFVSSPAALILAFASIVFWAASGPHFRYSADWLMLVNSGGTIVTVLMVFVLNNAQSRDTTAINAKLDALILAIEGADNRVVGVEHKTIEETREVHEHLATAVADAESATDDRESIRTR
jgi:low affinity Fe/Cu permease